MKQKFKEFTKQVMCRRGQNQYRAQILWVDLRKNLTEQQCFLFRESWGKYLFDEITPDEFIEEIGNLRKQVLR